MRWQELREQLDADPQHRESLQRELPYRGLALAVAGVRGAHDLTQVEFAKRLGTAQSVIARIESGRHAPNVKLLDRIAAAFGLEWHVTFAPPQVMSEAIAQASVPVAERQHHPVDLQHLLNLSLATAARSIELQHGTYHEATTTMQVHLSDLNMPMMRSIDLGRSVISREPLQARARAVTATEEHSVEPQAALALAS